MKYGAVGTGYHSGGSYYDSSKASHYTWEDVGTNHAVTIVGWDDEYSKENFKQAPKEDGAWLVRNSRGTSYGIKGKESLAGHLFLGFLKVGCFAFGGAYGAIPLIRDVEMSYGWLSDEMLTYMIAVSESTPGPIMVNLATYIGSSQAGFFGAVIATLAVVLPSFLIILLVTALLICIP